MKTVCVLVLCLAQAGGCTNGGNGGGGGDQRPDLDPSADSGIPGTGACQVEVSRSGSTITIGAPTDATAAFPAAGATHLLVGVDANDNVVGSAIFAFDLAIVGHSFNDAGAIVGKERTIKRDSVPIYLKDCSKVTRLYVYDVTKKVLAERKVD